MVECTAQRINCNSLTKRDTHQDCKENSSKEHELCLKSCNQFKIGDNDCTMCIGLTNENLCDPSSSLKADPSNPISWLKYDPNKTNLRYTSRR